MVALLGAEPGFQVVGESATAEQAVRLALDLRPDLVLMDISMPEMGGISATRHIVDAAADIRILVLTVHEDRGLMEDAIHAGASGYILKSAIKAELLTAIHTVLRGDLYLQPAMARLLFAKVPAPAQPEQIEALTPREVEILRLLAQGYTNRQAAELLNISVRTVEYHRSNLTDKLNLHSRVELVRYVEEHGLM
jgi:two-component system response regulator NreC